MISASMPCNWLTSSWLKSLTSPEMVPGREGMMPPRLVANGVRPTSGSSDTMM
ncbi:hypothetical protein D3C78_1743500 [compost metagenome]